MGPKDVTDLSFGPPGRFECAACLGNKKMENIAPWLVGHPLKHQEVASLIPGWGTRLGWGLIPVQEGAD